MHLRWTFLLLWLTCLGCVHVAGDAPDGSTAIHPRWAQHFHWEEDGRVLVLHADVPVRVVKGIPNSGETGLPVQDCRLATWSTTHVALLESFGGLDGWAGGTGCAYLQSSEALKRLEAGSAMDLGEDANSALEKLLWNPPGAVTVFPFHDPFEGLHLPADIPALPVTEYLEPHPLGRAEWMRAFGWLIGQNQAADSVFAAVESRYLALQEWASTNATSELLVFTGSIDGDAFWAPSGKSFIAQFLKDAGVRYAFAEHQSPGSIPVSFEELLDLNRQVDTWGLVWNDADSITWPEIAASHPVYASLLPRSGLLFAANTRTCDYFGTMVATPDILLADLIDLFHGDGGGDGCFEWIPAP